MACLDWCHSKFELGKHEASSAYRRRGWASAGKTKAARAWSWHRLRSILLMLTRARDRPQFLIPPKTTMRPQVDFKFNTEVAYVLFSVPDKMKGSPGFFVHVALASQNHFSLLSIGSPLLVNIQRNIGDHKTRDNGLC